MRQAMQPFGEGLRLFLNRRIETEMKNGPKHSANGHREHERGAEPKFATYRRLLEKKAEEVRRSMSAQKAAQVVARLDVPSDEGDLSQQHHEEWIFLNRNTLDMKLLREIADALHRIEHDTYGICPECEEPISAKRLDAVPWARYCVTCQERIAARQAAGEVVDELEEAHR
jgi:DnaK suppressor protein